MPVIESTENIVARRDPVSVCALCDTVGEHERLIAWNEENQAGSHLSFAWFGRFSGVAPGVAGVALRIIWKFGRSTI